MERLCAETLPPGMAFEWTEINYMQIDAAKNIWNNLIFPLAVVFVFLVLAAQYESWALPLAVILVVPMCILGSLTGVAVTHGDINIFTQIGFVVLVGLASKNAILIVEFAKHKREAAACRGARRRWQACQLRLRPILMTSFAFILGVVPLILGTGAGAEMRRTLGIAVFSGMLGVTLFGIFLTPVFFYVIEWFVERRLAALGGGRGASGMRCFCPCTLCESRSSGPSAGGPALRLARGHPNVRASLSVSQSARRHRTATASQDGAGANGDAVVARAERIVPGFDKDGFTEPRRHGFGCAEPVAPDANRRRSTEPDSLTPNPDRPDSCSCFRASSSTGRSSPRCCPSSSSLAGGIALFTLPVAQYPEIAPPTVEVSASYPGANAQVVADTVAAPIEQQVNGVESMMYMSSQCTNDGNYTLTVTFKPGTDLNISQVLVQNRESLAEPILPDLVKRRGISVKKKSPNVLMIVNLFSTDDSRDNLDLSNYATIQIRDELSRLPGVGDITYLGQRDYSMRLWLDPQKLAAYSLNAAGRDQRRPGAEHPGGGRPDRPAADADGPGVPVHHDHARPPGEHRPVRRHHRQEHQRPAGLPAGTWPTSSWAPSPTTRPARWTASRRWPCRSTSCPAPTPCEVAERVKERMKELKDHFPPGIDYAIVYDTTPFINESISEVFETLFDAIVLVAVVVLVFLQNWRSALIPLIAVPVAIIGTFAVMAAMGFSLNNLTLFGLVLAIGIVVDDAIVVVEAVEHHIEHGLAPREATIRAMEQVSGPVVAIGLVLAAVFVPCAFITGITGQFFRQFALTIAVSTVISAFNSLTLSPALAALLAAAASEGDFRGAAVVRLPADRGLARPQGRPSLGGAARWPPCICTCSPATLDAMRLWGPIVVGAAGGDRASGWSVGQAAQLAARLVVPRCSTSGFDLSTGVYTRAVSGLLRVSVVVLAGLRRPAGPDLLGLHAHADRLHPAAGQGLSAGQRAAARRRLGGAHQRGGAADRGDRPARRRASSTRSPSPASRSCSTPTPPTSGRCT